jgi:hypothetical protein
MPAEISSTTVAGVSAGQPKPTSSAVEHVGGGHDAAVRCGHDGRVVAGAEQGGGGL